jgi:hypothetical protein
MKADTQRHPTGLWQRVMEDALCAAILTGVAALIILTVPHVQVTTAEKGEARTTAKDVSAVSDPGAAAVNSGSETSPP